MVVFSLPNARPLEGTHECPLGIVGGKRLDVADGGGSGVGIDPSVMACTSTCFPFSMSLAEAGGNDEGHQGGPFVQQSVDPRLAVDRELQVEILRVQE